MNKYLLFCASDYYPSGGWEDFVGDYDSVKEAEKHLQKDFYQIVDQDTGEVVKTGRVNDVSRKSSWVG